MFRTFIFLNILLFVQGSFAQTLNKEFSVSERNVSPGIVYRHYSSSQKGEKFPLDIHLLQVDLQKNRVELALSQGKISSNETISSIVKRRGALAGINGGFFVTSGPYEGDIEGFYLLNGKVLSEPLYNRSSFGICNDERRQFPFIDQIQMKLMLQMR